jgi:hypothetical protein
MSLFLNPSMGKWLLLRSALTFILLLRFSCAFGVSSSRALKSSREGIIGRHQPLFLVAETTGLVANGADYILPGYSYWQRIGLHLAANPDFLILALLLSYWVFKTLISGLANAGIGDNKVESLETLSTDVRQLKIAMVVVVSLLIAVAFS